MTKRQIAWSLLCLLGMAVVAFWLGDGFWAKTACPLILLGLLILGIYRPKEEFIAEILPRASDEAHSLLSKAARFTLLFSGAAFINFFLQEWFSEATSGVLFLLFLLLGLISLGIGVLLACLGVISAFTADQSIGNRLLCVLSGLGMPVVLLASTVLFMATGQSLGTSAKLLIMRSHYEDIIAEAARHPKEDEGAIFKEYATAFYIDYGPPIRAAFPSGFRFLDNWNGIVYDPTGDVMLADGWDNQGNWRAPERITKLFDGDIVSCRPLWGDYYHCSFT